MIFDNNILHQTYRILVSIFCTLGMFAAVTPLRKSKKRNFLILTGYGVYSIIICFVVIRTFGFLSFLQTVIFTISLPGVIITYMITDTSVPRHIFTCLSQLLISCYLIASVTHLNTLLGSTLLSNAIILPIAYLLIIFLEFFFLRKPFWRIADTARRAEEIRLARQYTHHLLSHVALLAKEKKKETLPVDSAELSICFANALENAIQACEALPQNEREIIVKCIYKPKFMFEIANTYKGRVSFGRDGLPQSSVPNHGIGTRSIMAFCQKHNAFWDFTAEGGWFKITIAVPDT